MSVTEQSPHTQPAPTSAITRFLRARLFDHLRALKACEIHFHDALGATVIGSHDAKLESLKVHLHVHHLKFYDAITLGGSNAAAEAYMDGLWECDDLVALIRIFVRNRNLVDQMERGPARIVTQALKFWHWAQRNTRDGSKRNIAAHYDLGNELFEQFLDSSMMYSSAIFANSNESLEQAQIRKLDRICKKLGLQAGMRVIEIGTGWGGFAVYAAKNYGVHVTTTTISPAQLKGATQRVNDAGLQADITLLQQDYRDLNGQFDRLVSIEMIEAIGHQYLDTYFNKCANLLKPDGMALIQAITIEDYRYQMALREVDFIKRYIFPGSFIPSIQSMTQSVASVTDLKLFQLEDIGPSYALTLHHWRARFNAKLNQIRTLGYDERFVRMWNWYLAYCEGGFIERAIGDVQMLLVKPGARPNQFLPDLEPLQ